MLYLTYRCNLKCDMCYQHSLNHKRPELDADEIRDLLVKLKPSDLYLVGGEIFVRRDIYKIFDIVEDLGIATTLLTNGTLIDARGIDYLKRSRHIQRIILSLDGLEEAHDRIRGKGAYRKTTQVLEALASSLEMWTNTVILPTNVGELLECANRFRAMGAQRVTFQYAMVYSAEEYKRTICDLQAVGVPSSVSKDTVRNALQFGYGAELKAMLATIAQSPAREWVRYIPEFLGGDVDMYEAGDVRAKSKVCCADFLESTIKIGPEGEFELCEAMHADAGNALREDPLELWNGPRARQFRQGLAQGNMVDMCTRCCRLATV